MKKLFKRMLSAFIAITIAMGLYVFTTPPVSAWSEASTILSGKFYYVLNLGAGKSWDVKDESTESGAQMQMWKKVSNHQNQVFRFINTGDGWIIQPWNSQLVLGVENSSKSDGALVVQQVDEGLDSQRWDIGYGSNENIFGFKNRNSKKYITIEKSSKSNGARLVQSGYKSTWNQKFKLAKLSIEDVLSATWTRQISTSEISWTWNSSNAKFRESPRGIQVKISDSSWKLAGYYPTIDNTYLVRIEYIDPQTVSQIVWAKSEVPTLGKQLKNLAKEELKEESITFVLEKAGFKLPVVGIALGIYDLLNQDASAKEWEEFRSYAKPTNGKFPGIIKYTYVTTTFEPGGLNGEYWVVYLKESYEYSTWTGSDFSGQEVPSGMNGSWIFNYK